MNSEHKADIFTIILSTISGTCPADDFAVQMDLSLAKLLHQKWKQTIQVSTLKLRSTLVILHPMAVRQRMPVVMSLAEVVDGETTFYCPQVVKKSDIAGLVFCSTTF